jgi:cyanophycin synthetase
MVDYAHNPGAIQAIGEFIRNENPSFSIGIVTGVGDRRDEDIISLGKLSAQIFDEIIIRQDEDLRGRADMEITHLITKGVREINLNKQVTIIPTKSEAVVYAIKYAKKGSFITVCSEKISKTLNIIKKCKAEEDKYGLVIGNSIFENEDPELLTGQSSPVV